MGCSAVGIIRFLPRNSLFVSRNRESRFRVMRGLPLFFAIHPYAMTHRSALLATLLLVLNAPLAQAQVHIDQAVQEASTTRAWLDLYLYVGGSDDWNAVSAAWDAKRVPQPARLQMLRQRLEQQGASRLDDLEQAIRQHGLGENSVQRYWLAPVIRLKVATQELAWLASLPMVESIHLVPSLSVDEAHSLPALPVPGGHESAHDLLGASWMWAQGYTGHGRKVYIIDSGVDPGHPALGSTFWGNFVPASQAWFDPGGSGLPRACDNHGTLVAGVILGLNAANADTTGMAPGAVWMASPAAGNPACQTVDMLAALQFALDPDGDPATSHDLPDVINNSWSIQLGAPDAECTGLYRDAFAAIEAAGIAVVFSAGNLGPGPQTIPSPKNLNINPVNVFTVGSVNGNQAALPLAFTSSRGPSTCTGGDSIKPEVVAPGVSVRTTTLNGAYSTATGTSFAAPQAAGAVLLLKEAFPAASGRQLLESLYFTANDLGAAGEDNEFGMGIFSLENAFNWLVAQGFVPQPVSDSNNIRLTNLNLGPSPTCDTLISPFLSLENAGPNAITELVAVVTWQGITDTVVWQGSLASGNTGFWGLPGEALAVGHGTWSLEVVLVNGTEDPHWLDNSVSGSVVRRPGFSPAFQPREVCEGQQIYLGSSGRELRWYAQAWSQTPLPEPHSGLWGPFSEDISLYVTEVFRQTAGASLGTAASLGGIDGAYLTFDAEQPFTLEAVQVYSEGDGQRRIQLWDQGGNLLADTTLFINTGPRVLALGFEVPAGENLRLAASGTLVRLLSRSSGVQFPYTLPGVLSIDRSSLGDSLYPYFFDWQIVRESCPAEMFLDVEPGSAQPGFLPEDTTLYLAAGGSMQWISLDAQQLDYHWDFGDGTQEVGNNPVHQYDSAGIFRVYHTASGPSGCKASAAGQVTVLDWALGLPAFPVIGVKLFPNPVEGELSLSWPPQAGQRLELRLVDLLGREVLSGSHDAALGLATWDLSSLPAGAYWLDIRLGNKRQVRRLAVH